MVIYRCGSDHNFLLLTEKGQSFHVLIASFRSPRMTADTKFGFKFRLCRLAYREEVHKKLLVDFSVNQVFMGRERRKWTELEDSLLRGAIGKGE